MSADTWSGASRAGGSGAEGRMAAAVSAVSSLFLMSSAQLTSALASGQSMTSIATAKGVSSSDLMTAIKTGVQQGAPQGSAAPGGSVLTKIASNIAQHTGSVTGGHHRHRGGGTAAAATSAVTSTTASTTSSASSSSSLDIQA